MGGVQEGEAGGGKEQTPAVAQVKSKGTAVDVEAPLQKASIKQRQRLAKVEDIAGLAPSARKGMTAEELNVSHQVALEKMRTDSGKTMIPDLSDLPPEVSNLEHVDRHVNSLDRMLMGPNKFSSYLGPTKAFIEKTGADINSELGGTGMGPMLTHRRARALWLADNAYKNVDVGIKEGSPESAAVARITEDKATPDDQVLAKKDSRVNQMADNIRELMRQAYADPRLNVTGYRENYLNRLRNFTGDVADMERGVGKYGVDAEANRRTSFLQFFRTDASADVPQDAVRSMKAYLRAVGYEAEMKPALKQADSFIEARAPDGKPYLDGTDRKLLNDVIDNQFLHRELPGDAEFRRTPGVKQLTAGINRLLTSLKFKPIANPAQTATRLPMQAVQKLFVSPPAAALSHFLGDAIPKIAAKGPAGLSEYASGAYEMMTKLGDAEWSELERRGVAQRPSDPGKSGLRNTVENTLNAVKMIDTASKVATFKSEVTRLMGTGRFSMDQAQDYAASLAHAKNYYSDPMHSPPASASSRFAQLAYQFNKPGANQIGNVKVALENAAATDGALGVARVGAKLGLGYGGLVALGSAMGIDLVRRLHALPHDVGGTAVGATAQKIREKGVSGLPRPWFLRPLDDPFRVSPIKTPWRTPH